MYQAKQDGSRYQVYAPEMNELAVERLTLQSELHEALDQGQLTLHYQPQIDVRNRRLTGVEALVRWNHPHLGLVPPARFIAVAEETGLIWDLGRQVLENAAEQLARWQHEGWAPPRMAVNVSPVQLRPELVDIVQAALDSHGLAAGQLELEITESALTADGPAVLELLGKLHDMGVAIAVDDFGVGYSSLAMLRSLPLTTLKIDRSFTEEIAHNQQDATLVQCVMNMAHGLGLRVVAEGVEDQAQHVALRVMGCDDAQGYLFSRPLPPEELKDWARKQYSEIS
jgi:EAL domain-containing protein (putative c-di-GMP-specific phosphodiesterase class I)